jgi:hypothetical protein
VGLSRRSWLVGLGLSAAALVVGTAGFLWELPANRAAPEAITYVAMSLAIVCLFAAGAGERPLPVLAGALMVDLEAVLLGGGPLLALPFLAAVLDVARGDQQCGAAVAPPAAGAGDRGANSI